MRAGEDTSYGYKAKDTYSWSVNSGKGIIRLQTAAEINTFRIARRIFAKTVHQCCPSQAKAGFCMDGLSHCELRH